MSRRTLPLLLLCLASLPVASARALFHIAHIAEVNANAGGDSTEQYVEIEMEAGSQNVVANSVLSAWDCAGMFLGDLLVVPTNVANSGNGVRWIMATKATVGGIAADFVIPDASPDIPLACGQVCWGAPGFTPPADPNSWSRSDLGNFVDCVSYGPYTGPTKPGSGSPSSATPGDGTFALHRVNDTTLVAACPDPENNAGAIGDYGPCTNPTTTTTTTVTTTSTSTPTTTLPPGTADLLPGKKLDVRVKSGKPEKSKLAVSSQKDPTLTLGDGAGSGDDPRLVGGSLYVATSSPGGAFTGFYPLTSATGAWKAIEKKGVVTGYTYTSANPTGGATFKVTVKEGKTVSVKGSGEGLTLDLTDTPAPVAIRLQTGDHAYCLEFGGTPKFKAGKSFSAKKALAPGECVELPD